MHHESLALLRLYLETFSGGPLDQQQPLRLSADDAQGLLWPLLDLFRADYPALSLLPYRPEFEIAADTAIQQYAWQPKPDTWKGLKPQVWRVLLERTVQAHTLIASHVLSDSGAGGLTVPQALPEDRRQGAAAIFYLHRMALPMPPVHRAGSEWPEWPKGSNPSVH